MSVHEAHSHASHNHAPHNSQTAGHAHHHPHSGGGRLLLTIIFNLGITLAEVIGGLVGGSLALLSDAAHNFGDVLALVISYTGDRLATTKASTRFSFGLKRAEIFAALINGIALFGLAGVLAFEAFDRFYAPPRAIDLAVVVPVAAIGLFGNLLLIWALFRGRDSSLTFRSAFLHMWFDALASIVVLLALAMIALTGRTEFDLIATLLVSAFIVRGGWSISRDCFKVLLLAVPDQANFEAVTDSLRAVAGVRGVHELHIWSLNSTNVFLSCHLSIAPASDANARRLVLAAARAALLDKFGIDHTTIEIEEDRPAHPDALCDQ